MKTASNVGSLVLSPSLWTRRILRWLDTGAIRATAAWICFAVIMVAACARALRPVEQNYTEGLVLSGGVRVLEGATPYPPPGDFPYTFNLFGPIGYLLTAAALKIGGVSLFGPRLLVLIAGAVSAIVIAELSRRMGGRWEIGFLMGLLFLAGPLGQLWYPLLRVDYWAILFSLVAILALLAFKRAWPVALILFGLAVLTKITAIAAPLAGAAELFLQRKYKRAVVILAGTAVVLLPSVIITQGPLAHLLGERPESYRFAQALAIFSGGVTSCLLAVGVITYAAAMGIRWTSENRLAWLYLAVCTTTAFSAGNIGADSNHLLEWSATVSLVAGLSLSGLLKRRDSLASLFVLAFLVLTTFWTLRTVQFAASGIRRDACAESYAFIASFQGDRVLSENISALVLAGKPVLVSDPYMMTKLGDSVKWSRGSMEELAARKYFDLIVLDEKTAMTSPGFSRWSSALMQVISRYYRLARHMPCMGAAYVPRAPEGSEP
jgi:hypothetical protein